MLTTEFFLALSLIVVLDIEELCSKSWHIVLTYAQSQSMALGNSFKPKYLLVTGELEFSCFFNYKTSILSQSFWTLPPLFSL